MRKQLTALLLAITIAGGFSLNAQAEGVVVEGADLYTLTNLHPDAVNMRLYSTNYQLPAIITRCTKVSIVKLSKKKMRFSIENGTVYDYLYHKKSTPEGFSANMEKYFGPKCNPDDVKKLSDVDQEGIKKGRALLGMTKKGVILATGYPPEHVTPSTDMDQWRYWKNKFATRLLYFEDGKVSEITG